MMFLANFTNVKTDCKINKASSFLIAYFDLNGKLDDSPKAMIEIENLNIEV